MRFWPEVPSVFISLITNFSFLLSNWLKMYNMWCIRQKNPNYYFPFYVIWSILQFWHLGVCLMEKLPTINVSDRWHYTRKREKKYRDMFETQKSGNKTSSGEIGLDIRTHASPKVGQDQVSGGISVVCWHAAPVANVLWKPCTIR